MKYPYLFSCVATETTNWDMCRTHPTDVFFLKMSFLLGLWFSWTKPVVVHECGIEQGRWNVAHAVLIQSDWMRLRELLINVPLRGGSITDRKRAQRAWGALLAPCGPNKMADIQTAFECIFLKELFRILIQISLELVTKGPIEKTSALVQAIAWRRTGAKPLSQAILTKFRDTILCQWMSLLRCELVLERQ